MADKEDVRSEICIRCGKKILITGDFIVVTCPYCGKEQNLNVEQELVIA